MKIKGHKEYKAFKAGKKLTFKQAILAQCYVCNGEEGSGIDCQGVNCPLYPFHPYNKNRLKRQKSGTYSHLKTPKKEKA